MKKTKWIVPIITIVLLLSSAFAYALPSVSIRDFFTNTKTTVDQASSANVAESPRFNITEKEFVQFKSNVEMISALNGISFKQTNMEILKSMVIRKLVLQTAIDEGITATDQEVRDYALKQKALFDDNNTQFKELRDELIKASGYTQEQYWTSPELLQNYKEWLIANKFIDSLYAEKKLTNQYTYKDYSEELWNQAKDGIKINQTILNKN